MSFGSKFGLNFEVSYLNWTHMNVFHGITSHYLYNDESGSF